MYFFTKFMYFYETFFALILIESNSLKMIMNRVLINVRLHVNCLNTSTYMYNSPNVPLIYTKLWTDNWLVYALIGQHNRAT